MNNQYQEFKEYCGKLKDIAASIAVMNWDMEIYMPKKSGGIRGQQLATLNGIYHDMVTDQHFGNLMNQLVRDDSLSFEEKKNVEVFLDYYNKEIKFDTEFVKEKSRLISNAFQSWDEAKKNNDFSLYAPHLKKLVALKRKEAEILGFEDSPYDALLDQYDKGSTAKQVEALFDEVRLKLVPFVKLIQEKEQVNNDIMYRHYDHQNQWDFGIFLLKQMGYDFDTGRQDLSSHPFTTSFGPQDVRVTTRVKENDLAEMIWSCIHEGGHALYEQGLSMEHYGMPQGEYTSLGIHESQSRLYENNVGRSLPYWKYNFSVLKGTFPEQLENEDVDSFYKAMNKVESSLVRTNADELTYHFHIMIRFEIEKMLIEGDIEVEDLPRIWNEKYKSYLNIEVPNDAEGVLQDIHWAHGGFGYFPTYSQGSFYAAQFYAQAKKEMPDLEKQIENADLKPLKEWLNKNIHSLGQIYTSDEVCKKVTGESLNFKYFYDYAVEKYSKIYELELLEKGF